MGKSRAGRHHCFSWCVMTIHRVTLCVPAALIILASCGGGLPRSVRRDIETETAKRQEAARELRHSEDVVNSALAGSPDLFQGVPEPAEWKAKLQASKQKLDTAGRNGKQLEELLRRDRADTRLSAERLLDEERRLREAAVADTKTVESAASKWLAFSKDPVGSIARMKENFEAVENTKLDSVSTTVEKAEKDWPTKKPVLEERLTKLREVAESARSDWDASAPLREQAAPGKLGGPQLATLVRADEALASERKQLNDGAAELTSLSGQLYDSWDKVLTDLEISHFGRDNVYRECIKTVRTHLEDVAANKSQISNDEHWVTVSEPAYRAIENDLGMTIAHKDVGLFDSEALNTPQPPGLAYVAPMSVGHNQYGYWTNEGGHSVWAFLPQYLLMRELLRSHDYYRPITVDEYNGYRTAQRSGTTYYGRTPGTSAPTYGSHGTFTQQRYAGSRYVQSGGFKGSAYASPGGSAGSSSFQKSAPAPQSSPGWFSSGSAGHRFGTGA